MKNFYYAAITLLSLVMAITALTISIIIRKQNVPLENDNKLSCPVNLYNDEGIPYKKALGQHKLTFYCMSGTTASGTKTKIRRTIAVDRTKIPFGSLVYIKNYGFYIAEDTGSAIKGNRIDIYVKDCQHAKQLGVKHADVYLLQ